MSAWLPQACISLWQLDLIEKHHSVWHREESSRYQQSRPSAPKLPTARSTVLTGIPGTSLIEFKLQSELSVTIPKHEDRAVP
ncbi:hypothetical protein ARMGADRAFT_1013609 [Armillaria gallica]|uniref:Uncharacterized protein n=1 Tax=Armillaria gallica TaxID=47427 RepID=A0A2H3D9C5_ARMGA|nr:hypothetical protein ARMGADRAFT_1013609 [Armillaria gallica]